MYSALIKKNDAGPFHKRIWKGKAPQKIKFFMWLMTNDALLTKDYLFHFLLIRLYFVNRALLVISYIKIIIIDHLFFTCPIAKVIWAVTAKGIGELIMYLHPWLNVGPGVSL